MEEIDTRDYAVEICFGITCLKMSVSRERETGAKQKDEERKDRGV